jgi:hypothetical protein
LFIIIIFSAIIYSTYKKGQRYGIESILAASELGDSTIIDEKDSYKEQCKTVYIKLNAYLPDFTVNGIKIDGSHQRESVENLRKSLAEVMTTGGYNSY